MRLIGVAMVRNEADIVEAFVRHNLRFLDHLVVVDHSSSDATAEILRRLRDEGLPLTVGLDASIEFHQGRVLSAAMKQALERHGGDYGFALDADEFVATPSREALERDLARIPQDGIGYLRWTLHVPDRAARDDAHPFERMRLRIDDARVTMCKVVVPRAFASMPARWIDSGNHWVFDAPAGGPQRVVEGTPLDTRLAHLPFRSVAQTTQKVVLGHFAHRLQFGSGAETANINWHWRHAYQRILSRGLDEADLVLMTNQAYFGDRPFEYANDETLPTLVADPLPLAPLRYTDLAHVDPVARIAQWTDRLLASLER